MFGKSAKYTVLHNLQSVSETVEELQKQLISWNCSSEQVVQSILTIEEILVDIIQKDESDEKIYLSAARGLRKTRVTITFRGKEISLSNSLILKDGCDLSDTLDPTAENTIHEMVLNLMKERIQARYHRGVNTIRVGVETSEKANLIDSVSAILLAIVIGLGLRLALGEEASRFVAENIFQVMYVIFLRGMQLVVAPLIFFSLASCVAGLNDLSSLGRTGMKMMSAYMLTTVLAIFLTIGIDTLMLPGSSNSIILPDSGAAELLGTIPDISPSLKSVIINMMPNNFLGTFVNPDMLQIIILAILCAIVAGQLGKFSAPVKNAIDTLNAFFGTLTGSITKFLPLAIFGSFGNMMLTTDFSSMGSLAYWGLSTCIALFAMIMVYALLILVFGHLNPLIFLKKYFKSTLTAFSSSSSSAAMPASMECCRRLGVSPNIYSFSIPLGCTINMDGTAVLFMSVVLFLARVYGIELSSSTMVSIITTTMLLSLAMPGVPGGATAALLSLLAMASIPAEGLTIVLGIMSLIELQCTATNVTGDGAVTTIVAKSEGEFDKRQYYSRD